VHSGFAMVSTPCGAHTARAQGKITLAEALDIARFDVYEGYLDDELDHQQSQAAARRSR
jgi:hypothetical protein